jgi:elongation factor P hydroxylase
VDLGVENEDKDVVFSSNRKLNKSFFVRIPIACAIAAIVGQLLCVGAEAATTSYNDGDVFMGFRATSGAGITKDYVVNLGPASQFTSLSSGTTITLSLGNIGADLTAVFGPDWYTRQDPGGGSAVLWSIVGAQVFAGNGDPDNTIYPSNTNIVPWNRDFDSSQSFTAGLIDSMRFAYQGLSSTANSPVALIQNVTDANSYASFQPGGVNSSGISFQTYDPTIEAGVSQSLYLDRLIPLTGLTVTPGTLEGVFQISSTGTVTFTAGSGGGPTPTPTPTPTSTPSPTPTVTPTPTPTVTPTSIKGDFNGDRSPDYLLFNTATRQTIIWFLYNGVFLIGRPAPTLPTDWNLACVADFNGDRNADYVLFNPTTRQTAVWYLIYGALFRGALGPTLPPGWSLVAAADFNGDGNPDYLLVNFRTRQTAIWFLTNTALIGGAYGPTIPLGWKLIDSADFNGDGNPDYLLFNPSTHQTAIWYLQGASLKGGVFGPTLPAAWTLQGTVDVNGDGKPDYVLFNPTTRQTVFWYLNGPTFTRGAFGPTLPIGYLLLSP